MSNKPNYDPRDTPISNTDNFIAMVCREPDCYVAIVSPRELSRVGDTVTDPPTATSLRLLCEKHHQEGDYPEYFDKDGDQVSGDPETFETSERTTDHEVRELAPKPHPSNTEQFQHIAYAPLAQIEKELADSFEAFRTAPRDGYMTGTSVSSVIAAQQFTTRFAAHFDKVIKQELATHTAEAVEQATLKERRTWLESLNKNGQLNDKGKELLAQLRNPKGDV